MVKDGTILMGMADMVKGGGERAWGEVRWAQRIPVRGRADLKGAEQTGHRGGTTSGHG